jgi:hypothetical protein
MAYSWAKIYIEVIDDPKMGLLPDSLWRRVIEMILLAKKSDRDGWLPGVMEMSWSLRMTTEKLETDLAELSKIGIVELKDGNWFLTNFSKRQDAESPTERVREFRKRSRNADETSREETRLRQDTDKTRQDEESSRKRDLLFDAICAVCMIDPKVKGNGAKIGKARAALSDSEPPYSADEILAFGAWWNSDDWRRKKGPPSVWKLTEQIGIVRNGNGNATSPGTAPERADKATADLINKRRAEKRAALSSVQ